MREFVHALRKLRRAPVVTVGVLVTLSLAIGANFSAFSIVNGLLLLLTAWISGLFGFGLVVDGFWWGVLGALVLALVNWFIGLLLRPFLRRRQD